MPLKENWITEHMIDFEYKKYELLSYLNEVKKNYLENKIYPHLKDLDIHKKELYNLKNSTNLLLLNKNITGIDLNSLKFTYKNPNEKDAVLSEIFRIVEFAIPLISTAINDGYKIYSFVEDKMKILPIGLVPIRKDEGYLIFHYTNKRNVFIYRYIFSLFNLNTHNQGRIKIEYLNSLSLEGFNCFEKLKSELILNHSDLPNPAVYSVKSDLEIPLEETFIPVAVNLFERKMAA
ncbi:MAG: hypothetical protein ACK5D5_04010 [Bacteroidota bacterium]